jgi:hypothetical protein
MPISQVSGTAVLTLNDMHLLTHANGSTASTAREMGMTAQVPPRAALLASIPAGVVLNDLINEWAEKHRLAVLHSNHAVVDMVGKGIYIVDSLFEQTDGSTRLALFYYAPKRGGPSLKPMRAYAKQLLAICKNQMNFNPCVSVVCIHGTTPETIRTHTYAVHF